MGQLMLINPAKRPAKRKATGAQLRALAKARKARATAARPNPAKRPAMRAVVRSTRRKARRNPIGASGIMADLMGAAQGAGGALAVNAVVNLLPLPASMSAGWQKEAVKMAAAVALGTFGRKFIGRAAGKMAEGAMVVSAYNIISGMVPSTFGGSAVAGLGYMSPGMIAGNVPGVLPNGSVAGLGQYVSGLGGVGEYVPASNNYGY